LQKQSSRLSLQFEQLSTISRPYGVFILLLPYTPEARPLWDYFVRPTK